MRYLLIILFLTSLCQISSGQVNTVSLPTDTILVKQAAAIKDKPIQLENFFKSYKRFTFPKTDTLGFGWISKTYFVFGKNIFFTCDFFYQDNTLKSYCLKVTAYKLAYRKLRSRYFTPDMAKTYIYLYNERILLEPLKGYRGNKHILSKTIRKYMSPNSGLIYSCRTLEQNRITFEQIKDSLSPDQIVAIMYAINPVSRLTAFEYYLNNKEKFTRYQHLDKWIKSVFKELPTIPLHAGDLVVSKNATQAVEQCARKRFFW